MTRPETCAYTVWQWVDGTGRIRREDFVSSRVECDHLAGEE